MAAFKNDLILEFIFSKVIKLIGNHLFYYLRIII